MSCKHLVKRKNSSVYHCRIIAPTDLMSVLIQQSLKISLSTGIHSIAQVRARKLNQFVLNLFSIRPRKMHGVLDNVRRQRTRKGVSSCRIYLVDP